MKLARHKNLYFITFLHTNTIWNSMVKKEVRNVPELERCLRCSATDAWKQYELVWTENKNTKCCFYLQTRWKSYSKTEGKRLARWMLAGVSEMEPSFICTSCLKLCFEPWLCFELDGKQFYKTIFSQKQMRLQ